MSERLAAKEGYDERRCWSSSPTTGWPPTARFGLRPRDAGRRGSHVTLAHPQAWQLTQALIARGVVPDFRTPDRLRLGPAPLYTRYVDVWDAMDRLRTVLADGAHEGSPPNGPGVT